MKAPLPDPLHTLDPARFETVSILKLLNAASRALGELKGIAATIPNEAILVNTLSLQEAKDSSEIENVVTTHDALYRAENARADEIDPAAKEVMRYRAALNAGYDAVRQTELLTRATILDVQERLEPDRAGLRKVPGTVLRDAAGSVVYEPPQDANEVDRLFNELIDFMHGEPRFDADPLVRMALVHHQFESIHPFYDGNGRTGRIVNVLLLVRDGLLGSPILSLSRHVVRTKSEYYERLQAVRDHDEWEAWVEYVLTAVERTARETTETIRGIDALLREAKRRIRSGFKFYSHDLINNLFRHPYTTIASLQRDLGVSRTTATKYLESLAAEGFLEKLRVGRTNYFVNRPLAQLLAGTESDHVGSADRGSLGSGRSE